MGHRVAGGFRLELGQGCPSDPGVEHGRIGLGGVYHIVRNEGEFGCKNGKEDVDVIDGRLWKIIFGCRLSGLVCFGFMVRLSHYPFRIELKVFY